MAEPRAFPEVLVERARLIGRRRQWTRRHARRFSLRTRWYIVLARRPQPTWRQWWADLIYLVRG